MRQTASLFKISVEWSVVTSKCTVHELTRVLEHTL